MRLINLTGSRFGRLVVICRESTPNKIVLWKCQCDCGNTKITTSGNLRSGDTESCGCIKSEQLRKRNFKHGKASSPEFQSWAGMINRCKNTSQKAFPRYGGRGIVVCDRWTKFENFYADMGERPIGHTLDRIDNDLGYEPGNCRWATVSEQNRNKRSNHVIEYNGEKLCISEWARRVGIDGKTIRRRLDVGWSVEKALTTARYESYGSKVRLAPKGNRP